MNAAHLKTVTVGDERVKSFTVPDPDNFQRILVITVNEMTTDGNVEFAVAASTQVNADANHKKLVDLHLSDAA